MIKNMQQKINCNIKFLSHIPKAQNLFCCSNKYNSSELLRGMGLNNTNNHLPDLESYIKKNIFLQLKVKNSFTIKLNNIANIKSGLANIFQCKKFCQKINNNNHEGCYNNNSEDINSNTSSGIKEIKHENNEKGTISTTTSQKKAKKISKKLYIEQGKSLISLLSNYPILTNDHLTNCKLNPDSEEMLHLKALTTHLEAGLFESALDSLDSLAELLKRDCEDNHVINNPGLFRKLYIYKLCKIEILVHMEKSFQAEENIEQFISLMENNSNNLENEEFVIMIIKMREKLANLLLQSHLANSNKKNNNKTNSNASKIKLEKSISHINDSIRLLQKQLKIPDAEKQPVYNNYYRFLIGSYHMLGVILRISGDYKESNKAFEQIIKEKEKNPSGPAYLIDLQYSVYLHFGVNHLSLKDYENAIKSFNIALTHLCDPNSLQDLESKAMVIQKLLEIYEKQGNTDKLMAHLEEKADLKLKIIEVKKQIFETQIQRYNKSLEEQQKNKLTNDNSKNNASGPIEPYQAAQGSSEASEQEKKKKDLEKEALFKNFEARNIKPIYLELARIYEEIVQCVLENDNHKKLEEYIDKACFYYAKISKESIFEANINFIIFMKSYDEGKFDQAKIYGEKIVTDIAQLEQQTISLINKKSIEQFAREEIELLEITEDFVFLSKLEKKAFLLRRFTTLNWYSFEIKFKFFACLSKLYKNDNSEQPLKVKYQNLALAEFDNQSRQNIEDVPLLFLPDVMMLYESKNNSEKFFEIFDSCLKRIKDGELAFLKQADKEMYSKTLYDIYFMKTNYLIKLEHYLEAKKTLKMFDDLCIKDRTLSLNVKDKENFYKTQNLLELKLKYIQV